MKKKFFLILMVIGLFCVGCVKNNTSDVLKNLTKKINNLKSYQLGGKLEVVNNDDVFNYDVEVSFKDKDYYRVSLKNLANSHEQIILKNDDGVYVVTPSLNKSFKFQSDWPNNNSQVYLLKSIISDIESDQEAKIIEENGDYIITSKVNFPNNPNLVNQKVTVDENLLIKKVEIQNSDGISLMTFTIDSINYKPVLDESYFEINSIINETNNGNNGNNTNNSDKTTNDNTNNTTNGNNTENNNQNSTQTTATIEDIVYPLYIPTGTVLENEEKVSKTDGERVILTFGGDKPFTLVEETTAKEDEFTIVPTYGEPFLLIDTVAALSENSINWVSNGIEYYIVSDVMNQNELIEIAKSVNVVSVLK